MENRDNTKQIAMTADMLSIADWEDMLATHNRLESEMQALRDRIFKRHKQQEAAKRADEGGAE